jgi:hypothetical protein
MNNNQSNLLNYIKENSEKAKENMREYKFINNISVYVKDDLPADIKIPNVLYKLKKHIPEHLFSGIDIIYIGQFDKLKKKAFNAAFMDGAIYISNKQFSEDEMIEDFVHELGHSIEEVTNFDLYSDETINDEFYAKRMKLKDILNANGYKVGGYKFDQLEYNEKFDMYLYEEIGYPALTTLTVGLFCSPYGATSIREYFANSFEHYFMKNPQYVKKLSPAAYKKIVLLTTPDYFEDISY